MSNKLAFSIILALSLLTRFIFFGHPNQIVFDEVHFGKFVSGYYTHQYYFDIHPPLGKLIIAGFAKLFHFQPEYSFAEIGQTFPDHKYLVLRFLPTLASVLLPLVIFWLCLELSFSTWGAMAAALLVVFENAILTQSRYILMDSFLLLFGFTALLFYMRYRNGRSWKNLIGMAIFGGMAASVKWTGGAFLALAGIIELWHIYKDKFQIAKIGKAILFFVVIPFALYFAIFAVHFKLLYKSGPGDAFMTEGFQKTLQGSKYATSTAQTPNLFEKFIQLNLEMYRSNQRLTAKHSYGSAWYTWPFMIRPIYYWVDTAPTQADTSGNIAVFNLGKIYLLGNPITWWLSTVAVIALIGYMITGEFRKEKIAWILLGGYLLNYLPFVGIKRVMFLYHYLAAVIFAILILVYLLERTLNKPRKAFVALIILAATTFIYFAPLTYGLPLAPKSFDQRLWLKTWL